MIGFGAIVKSIGKALETAGTVAVLILNQAAAERRPKLCPIPVSPESRRPRR